MSNIIQVVFAPLDLPPCGVHELLAARQRERRLLWHLRRTVRDARLAVSCVSVVHLWLDDVVDVVELDPDYWQHWLSCWQKLDTRYCREGAEVFICEKKHIEAVLAALSDYYSALRVMTEFEIRELAWQKARAA